MEGKSVFIPFANSYQCVNCDGITNQSKQCPGCASTKLVAISNFLRPVVRFGAGGILPNTLIKEQS